MKKQENNKLYQDFISITKKLYESEKDPSKKEIIKKLLDELK